MKQCAYCGTNYFEFVQQCENCGSMEFVNISNEVEPEEKIEDDSLLLDKRLPVHLIIFMLFFAGIIVVGLLVATAFDVIQFNSQYTNTSSPNAINIAVTSTPAPTLPPTYTPIKAHSLVPEEDVPADLELVSPPVEEPSSLSSQIKYYLIGDSSQTCGQRIMLRYIIETTGLNTKPSDGNTFVICEFQIRNNTGEDLFIDSDTCIIAYCDGDLVLESEAAELTFKDTKPLVGTIEPGESIFGGVGYELPSDWKELELRYYPNDDLLTEQALIFRNQK